LRAALGYSQEEIRDRMSDWLSLIFAADRDEVTARLSALMDGTARTYEAEFRMAHRDGQCAGSLARAESRIWSTVSQRGLLGTYVDVTEQKGVHSRAQASQRRLVRLGRTAVIGEVTASIAHELSQPLTAITTNVSACLRTTGPFLSRFVRCWNDILRDSRRASQILERTQRLFPSSTAQPAHCQPERRRARGGQGGRRRGYASSMFA
jgi:PAS domain S-box-containing protein